MHSYDEPVYLISVVANMLNIHPQTLRQYEKEGLVTPSRTGGKMRLYSQRDIDKIKMILKLTRELGVNIAGVDIILQLKEKIDSMREEIDELKEKLSQTGNSSIAKNRSIVTTKSRYEVIIFNE
jgi:MerR family transcriptional regulator/heat shock protein HspR